MVDAWWPWKLWSRGSDQREQPTGALVCTKYDSILQICKSAKNTLNSPEFQLLSMERHDCPFAEAEPLWLPMVPGGRVGSSTNVSVQGEANSNFERDLYNCTFPTLIGDKKIKSKYISLQWYFKQTTGGSSSPSLRHLLGIFCTLKFWISL